MTKGKIVGWHHQLNVHEFEEVLGDGEGQGSLACCSPWGQQRSGLDSKFSASTGDPLVIGPSGWHGGHSQVCPGINPRNLCICGLVWIKSLQIVVKLLLLFSC